MDEDFNDLAADLGGDDFFDFDFETPFRSRSYTWPSRPPSFASPHVTDLEQTQLTQLRDVTENEVSLLSDIVQSCPEPPLSPGSVGGVRKVASRRNAWGNLSYADLITKAIESAPEKRLTLSQIYAWMVDNVPFFSDKGDSNSSAGWKNSIRHNLSLHSRFVRYQNEGTGKSSWWTLSSDNAVKPPRKRAGTMDTLSNFRRPGKHGKQPSGRHPKSARSSETLTGLSDTASDGQWKPMDAELALNPPVSTSGALGQTHSFLEYRHRSFSGESSNAGVGHGLALEPLLKSSWDVPYLTTEPAGLADIFLAGVSDHQQPASLLPQHQPNPPAQRPPMFLSNEAYAHGVPIHRPPVSLCHLDVTHSPSNSNSVTTFGTNYLSSVEDLMAGIPSVASGISAKQQQVPILSNLLHEKPQSSVMLGGLLMSGGNMSVPVSNDSSNNGPVGVSPILPSASEAGSSHQMLLEQVRRPFQMNQKLLMQLLANKPHLAARVQQLIDAKRRQQTAASSAALRLGTCQFPESTAASAQGPFLEQLLSSWTTASDNSTTSLRNTLPFEACDEALPTDLDLSLLDFESTSDIDCDIDQVIQHELAFGDKLDFTFDQLHLDEFTNYPC